MKKTTMMLATMMLAAGVLGANEWYVSNGGTDAEGYGSEQMPFHSLQYAHDKAAAGDTVYVKPGVYDYGEVASTFTDQDKKTLTHTNRLVVTKKLYFRATGTREETHIVGAYDKTAANPDGPAAVRCVLVTADGLGSEFHNFTIRDGAADNAGGDHQTMSEGNGGNIAVVGTRASQWSGDVFKAYFVDCVISNGVAKWGGGMRGGTAIRCLFANNTGTSYGQTCSAAALWNCVVVGNNSRQNSRPLFGQYVLAVNTTVCGSAGCGFCFKGKAYNCVFTQIGSTEKSDLNDCQNTYWKADDEFPLASPGDGDYRLMAGTPAENGGNTEYLSAMTLPAGTEMKDFAGNVIDLTKATCNAGAIQGAGVVSEGGVLKIPADTYVDGKFWYGPTYVRALKFPRGVVLKPTTANFVRYSLAGDYGVGPVFQYLSYDGICEMMPPPYSNQVIRLDAITCAIEYWCNPEAVAAEATGSKTKPFRTIQDAIVAATNAYPGKLVVIHAMPGDYREGSTVAYGHNNRVVIPKGCPAFIKSTGGAAVTTIWGEPDPDKPSENYVGCGPNAMRCLAVNGTYECTSAIQGFTFADGHSGYSSESKTRNESFGGAIYARSTPVCVQVLDSVITNCTAVKCAVSYCGAFLRCKFYDCVSYGGSFWYSRVYGSYVDPSCRAGTGDAGCSEYGVLGNEAIAAFITAPNGTSESNARNCASVFGEIPVTAYDNFGSIYKKAVSVTSTRGSFAEGDPYFVDFEGGDYRLATATRADELTAATLPARGTAYYGVWASNIVAGATLDVNGNPMLFRDGRVLPGCYHTTVDGIYVAEAANGGVQVTEGKAGFNQLTDELSVTVTSAAGTRPCVGVEANGATNLFDEVASVTVTAADVMAAGGGLDILPIYTSDWYVNPDAKYSDANTGFTPKTAKRTLKGAVTADGLASGDTIHAAAGTYDSEKMQITQDSGKGTHHARVIVPGGVQLIGEGIGKSIITGEKDDECANGLGPKAVKCAFLEKNSSIRGFTFTGGYTGLYDTSIYPHDYNVDFSGGGVCSYNSGGRDSAFVYDSMISNCWAYTAGGARWLSLVRCTLLDNHAVSHGGAGREVNLYGCVVNRGYSGTTSSHATVRFFTKVANCTFGPDNWTFDGKMANLALSGGSGGTAKLENCLILGGVVGPGSMVNLVTNCVFRGEANSFKLDTTCRVNVGEEMTQVDADLRPVIGANEAIDYANADIMNDVLKTGYDLSGTQRVYNGRMDVGALEADWRGTYAKMLGRMVTVTRADEQVVAADGKVTISNGTLTVAWTDGKAPRDVSLAGTLKVTGNGTLDDGANSWTAADGLVARSWAANAAANVLDFTYTPGANDAGAAELLTLGRVDGFVITIR